MTVPSYLDTHADLRQLTTYEVAVLLDVEVAKLINLEVVTDWVVGNRHNVYVRQGDSNLWKVIRERV